ncbi:MAG TPA: hypothetical protein VF678_02375 [bacterium]
MHHPHCTRRELFNIGGRVLVGSILLSALPASPEAQAQEAINWRNTFREVPKGGSGKVKELEGVAFAGQRALKVGDTVNSGEQLRVTKNGKLVVSSSDGAIFQMKGEAVIDYHIGTNKSGIMNLVLGQILAVVPSGHRYLVAGPTATIGIKGTVVFRQIFREDEMDARAMQGKTYTRPRNLTDYFCTCNGEVDFLRNNDKSVITSDKAVAHSSSFLDGSNAKLLAKAPMINHFDRDIGHIIDIQDGPKHDRSFLK